jgi:hypothetical protein
VYNGLGVTPRVIDRVKFNGVRTLRVVVVSVALDLGGFVGVRQLQGS